VLKLPPEIKGNSPDCWLAAYSRFGLIGHRYQKGGLDAALYEKQRPGAASVLDQNQKQRTIAMVCSDPPEGRARWTVRLVVQEAVKRKLVPRVSRETIRISLLDHDLKPWRKKMWCVAELDDESLRWARRSGGRMPDLPTLRRESRARNGR
jgi:hypothetical protein